MQIIWNEQWSLGSCARSDGTIATFDGTILAVTPRAMSLEPVTVVAAAAAVPGGEDKRAPVSPLQRDELSLYTVPEQNQIRFTAPEAGRLEESVATARNSVAPYTDWCRVTYDQIKPRVQSGIRAGRDTYGYLKDPPKDFYPRAGVIGFTGILGLFLARRSRVKRLVYPVALMTLSASLYYPEQAAKIAKSAGDSVYERAVQGYAAVERIFKPPTKVKEVKESEGESSGSQLDSATSQ